MIEIKYINFKAFKKIAFIKILYFFLGWFRPKDFNLKDQEITDLVDYTTSHVFSHVCLRIILLLVKLKKAKDAPLG